MVLGQISGHVCDLSDDGYHHADSLVGCEIGSDKYGDYAVATVIGLKATVTLYSAEVYDRIGIYNAQRCYRYEIQRDYSTLTGGGINSVMNSRASVQALQAAFQNNLPVMMDGGFSFSGRVDVWEIDRRRIRVEVFGIERQIPMIVIIHLDSRKKGAVAK